METAWNPTAMQTAAVLLAAASRRFVFARAHAEAQMPGMVRLQVTPNARGRGLIAGRRGDTPPTIRLWVTFQPSGGSPQTHSVDGLPVAP